MLSYLARFCQQSKKNRRRRIATIHTWAASAAAFPSPTVASHSCESCFSLCFLPLRFLSYHFYRIRYPAGPEHVPGLIHETVKTVPTENDRSNDKNHRFAENRPPCQLHEERDQPFRSLHSTRTRLSINRVFTDFWNVRPPPRCSRQWVRASLLFCFCCRSTTVTISLSDSLSVCVCVSGLLFPCLSLSLSLSCFLLLSRIV